MKKIKRKKKRNPFIFILTIIFIGIFIFSLSKIILWYQDNQKSQNILETLEENIEEDNDKYKIDFERLQKENPDTVAFIKVKGTNIEYPIVKSTDNEYYLTHSFDKTINSTGWPFINYINKFDGTDKNITIFAHSRRDGSMFGTLYKTLSREWQTNEDNLLITFITESTNNTYQVFSTYKILNEDYYIKNYFETDDEYLEFLNTIKSRSNYDYNINLTKDDSIITLSTCASDDKYRIVLHAKKLDN